MSSLYFFDNLFDVIEGIEARIESLIMMKVTCVCPTIFLETI